jgi:hypothetical protein
MLKSEPAFKALLSAKIRHLKTWSEPHPEAAALLVFSTSKGFAPAAARCLRNGPLVSFAVSLEPGLAPQTPRRRLLFRVSITAGSACLLRDCRPFWPSCTSSTNRRFDACPCLAYEFTPPWKLCCQNFLEAAWQERGTYRSSTARGFGAPGIRHPLVRMTASQGIPLQSLSREPAIAGLSPSQRTPLVELECTSAFPVRGSIALLVWRSLCAVRAALRYSRPRRLASDLCQTPLRP